MCAAFAHSLNDGSGTPARLVLRDGEVFEGRFIGSMSEGDGEVVFNTAMSGYEEILTDPSYHRQIVVMTQPEMGSYGITLDDEESFGGPKAAGFIMREYNAPSNHRSKMSLAEYLARHRIPALAGVDTRRLTMHLRERGAMPGVIVSHSVSLADAKARAAKLQSMDGQNLAGEVSTTEAFSVGRAEAKHHVVLIDFGVKQNIAHLLAMRDCRVTVVSSSTSAADVLAQKPHGVLLSNGPGDPAATAGAVETVRGLIGKVPMFGICLGHQILGLALGGKTFKLKFGHRGGNQPVMELATGKVQITSQNHGFCVEPSTLPAGAEPTHVNLSDGTLEGFRFRDKKLFAVQFHPESSPGPHDAAGLFDEFISWMTLEAKQSGH